jgi:hypothetical protein
VFVVVSCGMVRDGVAARLRNGQGRNFGSIPGTSERIFFSRGTPYRLWGPPYFYSVATGAFPIGVSRFGREDLHSCLVPRL